MTVMPRHSGVVAFYDKPSKLPAMHALSYDTICAMLDSRDTKWWNI